MLPVAVPARSVVDILELGVSPPSSTHGPKDQAREHARLLTLERTCTVGEDNATAKEDKKKEKTARVMRRREEPLATYKAVEQAFELATKLTESGKENKCLYYAFLVAYNKIRAKDQKREDSCGKVNELCELVHELLLAQLKLPPDGWKQRGCNESMWTAQEATEVHENNHFRGELHVHALANLFECIIIVVQKRGKEVWLWQYAPGWNVQKEIEKSEVYTLLRRWRAGEIQRPVFLKLNEHNTHFEAMIYERRPLIDEQPTHDKTTRSTHAGSSSLVVVE